MKILIKHSWLNILMINALLLFFTNGIFAQTVFDNLTVTNKTYLKGNLFLTDPGANGGTGSKLILGSGNANGSFHSIGVTNYWTEHISHVNEGWRFKSTGGSNIYKNNLVIYAGPGYVGINLDVPTKALDINGEARIRTLNNAPATGTFLVVADANGVLYKAPAPTFMGGWVKGESCPTGYVNVPDPTGAVCRNFSGTGYLGISSTKCKDQSGGLIYGCLVCGPPSAFGESGPSARVAQVYCLKVGTQSAVGDAPTNDKELTIKANPNQLAWGTEENALQLTSLPNPFSTETTITLSLPEANEFSVFVMDLKGSLVKQFKQQGEKGENQFMISKTDLKGAGMYIVNVVSNNNMASTKIVMN